LWTKIPKICIFSNKLVITDFPQLMENASIFPNSKGGMVVQKGKKNHCGSSRPKSLDTTRALPHVLILL
jgi:hypothetical protein